MKAWPALCLLLLGCSQAADDPTTPRAADIDRLESRVSSHPCVGELDRWERNYRFAMSKRVFWPQSDHPNLDVIEFHFRRGGTFAITPGRGLVAAGGNRDWPDSSSVRSIDGSFVLSSGRLNVARCKPL